MCLAGEGKTDGEGRVSEGEHAAACRAGKRDPWCGGTDAGSQPEGTVATGMSLRSIQRSSESHRVGTFMEFDTCWVENVVNLRPRRARKEIKIGSIPTEDV